MLYWRHRLVKTEAAMAEAVALHEGLLEVTLRHHGASDERTAVALQSMAKVRFTHDSVGQSSAPPSCCRLRPRFALYVLFSSSHGCQ